MREAMTNQSLGNGEMLNTRWAHDDPNPKAMAASERANLQMVIDRVLAVDDARREREGTHAADAASSRSSEITQRSVGTARTCSTRCLKSF